MTPTLLLFLFFSFPPLCFFWRVKVLPPSLQAGFLVPLLLSLPFRVLAPCPFVLLGGNPTGLWGWGWATFLLGADWPFLGVPSSRFAGFVPRISRANDSARCVGIHVVFGNVFLQQPFPFFLFLLRTDGFASAGLRTDILFAPLTGLFVG